MGCHVDNNEPDRKRRKVVSREHNILSSESGSSPNESAPPPLICNVHSMKLCYADSLDKAKFDRCRQCDTPNDYDLLHFIYVCQRCQHFCCNFCFADLYNKGQTDQSLAVLRKIEKIKNAK